MIQIGGHRFGYGDTDGERMRRLVSRWPNRRAILNMERDLPYRCIGGVVYTLQRERFQVIDLLVDGKPWLLPTPR